MDSRTKYILKIRPHIPSVIPCEMISSDEHFQNTTLRPVLKFQNDLLIEAFRNYTRKHKNHFQTLDIEGKLDYIVHSIQKDMKFRNSLKGIIIGQFTVPEYLEYIKNSSAHNKRMMNMVIERLKDHLQFLEDPMTV